MHVQMCCACMAVYIFVTSPDWAQVEEQRRHENERTGKVQEDMAHARVQLKRIDKDMRALKVLLLVQCIVVRNNSRLLRWTSLVGCMCGCLCLLSDCLSWEIQMYAG